MWGPLKEVEEGKLPREEGSKGPVQAFSQRENVSYQGKKNGKRVTPGGGEMLISRSPEDFLEGTFSYWGEGHTGHRMYYLKGVALSVRGNPKKPNILRPHFSIEGIGGIRGDQGGVLSKRSLLPENEDSGLEGLQISIEPRKGNLCYKKKCGKKRVTGID